jgi:hypothetical protein
MVHETAGHIAIPCAVGACPHAAPNANTGHGESPPTPGFAMPKNGVRSTLEAVVPLAVVKQVTDTVYLFR